MAADGTGDGPAAPRKSTALRTFVFVVIIALAFVVGSAFSPPEGVWEWTAVVGIGVLLALTSVAGATNVVMPWPPRIPGGRQALAITLAVLSVVAGMGLGALVTYLRTAARPCTAPTQVRVLTSPANVRAYSQVARAFEAATADGHRGCPTAALDVYAAPLAEIRQGLAKGWDYPDQSSPDESRGRGRGYRNLPRPDVWLPESPFDHAGVDLHAVGDPTEIGWTPLVLAYDQALTGQVPSVLTELVQRVTTPGSTLRFAHQRPTADSSLGQIATWAAYAGTAGQTPLGTEQIRTIERLRPTVANALSGGQTVGDADTSEVSAELTMLCGYQRMARDDRLQTVLLLTEQAYRWFTNHTGDCPTAAPPTLTSRIALTPADGGGSGAVAVTRTMIRLAWSDASGRASNTPQLRAAERFRRWLLGAGRCQLSEIGIRVRGACPAVGPAAAPARSQPDQNALDLASRLYDGSHLKRRVIVLLDTSGSMRDLAEAAKAGVRTLAAALPPGDELGVWTFPGGRDPTVVVLPVGPATPATNHDQRVSQALPAVPKPSGGTPLYRAIAVASDTLGPTRDETTAVIAVTDGQDSGGGSGPALLVPGDVHRYVVTIGGAPCPPVSAQVLRCRPAVVDTLGTELVNILTEL